MAKDLMPRVPRPWLCNHSEIRLDHRADLCMHDVNVANLVALSKDRSISGSELHASLVNRVTCSISVRRPTLRMLFGTSGACFTPINLTVDVRSPVQNSIWMVLRPRVFNGLPGVMPSISDGSALNSIKWFLFQAMCVVDPVSANQSDISAARKVFRVVV